MFAKDNDRERLSLRKVVMLIISMVRCDKISCNTIVCDYALYQESDSVAPRRRGQCSQGFMRFYEKSIEIAPSICHGEDESRPSRLDSISNSRQKRIASITLPVWRPRARKYGLQAILRGTACSLECTSIFVPGDGRCPAKIPQIAYLQC